MRNLLLCLAVLLLLFTPARTQQPAQPSEQPAIPEEFVKKPNPVKPTTESIAQGKRLYAVDCAFCHGANGDGKGEVAVSENMNLKDLRDAATLKGRTDGEIYYLLKKGRGHMPLEPIRSSPNDLWNLVNYVRSLPPKAAE